MQLRTQRVSHSKHCNTEAAEWFRCSEASQRVFFEMSKPVRNPAYLGAARLRNRWQTRLTLNIQERV